MVSPQAPRSRTDRLGFKTDHPFDPSEHSPRMSAPGPRLPTWAIQQSRQLNLGYFRRVAAVAGTAGLARFRSAVNALLLRKNDQPRRTAVLSFDASLYGKALSPAVGGRKPCTVAFAEFSEKFNLSKAPHSLPSNWQTRTALRKILSLDVTLDEAVSSRVAES